MFIQNSRNTNSFRHAYSEVTKSVIALLRIVVGFISNSHNTTCHVMTTNKRRTALHKRKTHDGYLHKMCHLHIVHQHDGNLHNKPFTYCTYTKHMMAIQCTLYMCCFIQHAVSIGLELFYFMLLVLIDSVN